MSYGGQVAPRNDVARQAFAISRRDAPGLCTNIALEKTEGAGKAGCPIHPQPRVRSVESTRGSRHRFTGITRPSLRNGFNGLLRALPGDRAFLPPSFAENPANSTPASGRQDPTTSPSANGRSRLWRRLRPPHSAPRP